MKSVKLTIVEYALPSKPSSSFLEYAASCSMFMGANAAPSFTTTLSWAITFSVSFRFGSSITLPIIEPDRK